jgi:hypothetical protein
MEKIFTKEELITQVLEVFQSKTSQTLTRQDGQIMLQNLVHYFQVLQDWEQSKIEKKSHE